MIVRGHRGAGLRSARVWSRLRAQTASAVVYALLGTFIVVGSLAADIATAPPAQAGTTQMTFTHFAGSTPSGSAFYRGDGSATPRGHDSFFDPWRAFSGAMPLQMRIRMMGGRGGYGGRDGSTGLNSPGNVGYVETVWFSPREIGVFPGDMGGDGASYVSCGGGGAGGYSHHSWDGGWGGRTGCRGSSGGGGGGGAASAVLFPGVGWIVAGGGGGAGGNGNFPSQSWMAGRSWNSNNGSFTGSYGGDPGGSDGGGGGGGGGGWNAGNGGGVSWVSWANEFGGNGGFAGLNANTAGIGLAVGNWSWNGNGRGWVSIDVIYAGVPSAPTSVSVSSVGDTEATISWGAPSDNGGAAVTQYEVCWGTTSAPTSPCQAVTTTSFRVTNLVNGTTYFFRVRARNAVGLSAFSNAVSGVPRGVPIAPSAAPTATEGNGQLALTWAAPNNNGAAITDYVIEFKPTTATTYAIWNDGVSTATSTTITGLSNGTVYDVRFAAVNAAGTGSFSPVRQATPFTAPGSPTAIQITRASDTSLTVSWTAPASNGGKAITRYWLERATGPDLTSGPNTAWVGLGSQPSNTSITDTGLATGTIYYYRVRADNGLLSPWSTGAAGRLATVPGIPATPTVIPVPCQDGAQTQTCSGAVDLTWPATANGGSEITQYRVQFAEITQTGPANPSWITATPTFSGSSIVTARITGLTNGTSYAFRVSAINVVGQGGWSTPSTFSTTLIPRTVPGAPTGLVVSGSGNGFADLTWTAPSSTGGLPIQNYLVEFSTDNGTTWTAFATRPTSTTATVTGLINGTTYRFRVSAGNASGPLVNNAVTTAYGNAVAATNTATPLTTPAAPTVTLTTGDETVTVAASLTDTGGTPVTGWEYSISRDAQGNDIWVSAGAASTFVINNLVNGTAYSVLVRAVNAVGVGAASVAVSGTPFRVPDRPSTPIVVSQQDSSVTIRWSAPASNGGNAIASYTIEYRTGSVGWSTATHIGATPPTNGFTIPNLTNGTAYEFRVFATNARGAGEPSASVIGTPRTVPLQPINLSIDTTVSLDRRLTVRWSAPTNDGGNPITSYIVEYSTSSDFTLSTTVSLAASALAFAGAPLRTSHTITGLVNGTEYHVRVRAVNAAGQGADSSAVTETPRTIPAAPQAVTVAGGNQSITITWTAPPATGGSAITGYWVEYRRQTPTMDNWIRVSPRISATVLSHTVAISTPETTWQARVIAENAVGEGPSAQSAGTALVYAPAEPPARPTVTAGNGQVIVRFNGDVEDNGSPVTGFRVTTWSADGLREFPFTEIAPCTTSTPVSETQYECIVTGLTNKTEYTFKVASANAAGFGIPSAPSTIAKPGTAPQTISVITSLTAKAGDRAIPLNAKASSGLPVSYSITSAQGICSFVGDSSLGLVSPDRAGTCTVRVEQSGANSAFAAATPVVVTIDIDPSAPSLPRITSVTATAAGQITVTWVPPTYDGGSAIIGYDLTVTKNSVTSGNVTNVTGTSQVISGLGVGTHTVTVTAKNIEQSAVSAPASVVVYGTPGTPTDVAAVTGDRSLAVTWVASTVNAGLPIVSFTAQAREVVNGVISTSVAGSCSTSGSATGCTITGLHNDTRYSVTVTEAHAYLSGAPSAAFNVTAGEIEQTVTFNPAPSSVAWSAGFTTVAAASDAGATIAYSRSAGSSTVCSVDSATGRVTLLRAGSCEITAFASGIGNAFATASATATLTVTAVAPSAVRVSSFGPTTTSGQVKVDWQAPLTDGGAAITGYTVTLTKAGDPNSSEQVTPVATVSTHTFAGLTPGSYTVAITATNGVATSAAVTAQYAIVVAPAAPTSVAATTGDGSLTVSWTGTPAGSNGGAPIISYRATASGGGSEFSCSVAAPGTSCTITGLTNDTSYTVTVVANNGSFISVPSVPDTEVAGDLPQTLSWVSAAPAPGFVTDPDLSAGSESIPFSQGAVQLQAVSIAGGVRTAAIVTYTTSSTACSVDTAGTVTALAAGICVITASQSGVGNAYAPAPSITFTLTINQVAPVAPVRTSWEFIPTTNQIKIAYRTPASAELGGGSAYTYAGKILGETPAQDASFACVATECTAPFTWPGTSTSTQIRISESITVASVTGEGAFSATVQDTITLTVFRPDPSAPRNVQAAAAAAGGVVTVTVTWTSPENTGNNNAETITEYLVTLTPASGSAVTATIPAITSGGDVAAASGVAYTQPLTAVAGTTYVVTVVARNSTYSSPEGGTSVTTPSAPSAPLGLRATAKANGVVDLSWTAPASNGGQSITGYAVSGSGTITQPTGTSTAASIAGLTPGTPYTFSVVATNAVGNSVAATVTVTAIDVPVAPGSVSTSFTISVPGDPPTTLDLGIGEVNVAWTAPTQNNGSEIAGYQIDIRSGTTVVASRTAAANATSLLVAGLPRGTYTAHVAAINAAGASPAGTSAPFTISRTQTIAVALNGTPVVLTERAGTATFSVTSPAVLVTAAASGGSSVTLSITDQTYCRLDPATGRLTFNTLGDQITRTCVLQATTDADTIYEAASASVTFTVNAVAPSSPLNVVATPGNASVTVTWDPPSSDGGADLAEYIVTLRRASNGDVVQTSTWNVSSPRTSTFTSVNDDITNGTEYRLDVVARSNGLSGVPSTPVSVTPRTIPDAPTAVTASMTQDAGQVQVSWTPPTNMGGSPITAYTATVLTQPGGTVLGSCTVVASATTCRIGGLTRGDGRTVQVVATNAAGSSAAGVAAATLNVGLTPSIAFTNAAGQAIAPVQGASSPVLETSYGAPAQRVFATSTSGAAVTFTVANEAPGSTNLNTGTPCAITPDGLLTIGEFLLQSGKTSVTCTITATTAADSVFVEGTQTLTVTVTATGPDAPDPVQLVPGNQSITITWTIPTRVGGAPITSYVVEYTRVINDGTPDFTVRQNDAAHLRGSITVQDPTVSSQTVTGLLNGYAYAVRVAAINAAGRGDWDPIATPSGKPLPVRGVTGATPTVVAGDRVITISWRAPVDATDPLDETITYFGDGGSPITGYTVTVTRTVNNQVQTLTCTVQPQPSNLDATLSCAIAVPLNKVPYSVSVGVTNVNGTETTNLGTATPVATQSLMVTASTAGTALTLEGTSPSLTGSFTYGTSVTLTATASSGLTARFATTSSGCSVSSSGVVTATAAGECVITVSQAGDEIFNEATPVTVTLTVEPNLINVTPTVSAIGNNKATMSAAIPWAGADVTIEFQICANASFTGPCFTVPGGTVTSTTTQAASGTVTGLSPSTTYYARTIITAGARTANSEASPAFTTLATPTITTAAPTLTALTPVQVTLTATGGTGTFSSWAVSGTLPTGLTFDTTTGVLSGTPSALETRTITISITDSGGNTGEVTYTLTVQGASPNLSIAPVADRSYSPTPLPLSVSAADLDEVTFASAAPAVCSVNSTTGVVTMLREGVCTISATSAAHGVYAQETVTRTFTIALAPQTISFPEIANRTFAPEPDNTFTIAATSSSGLPVNFESRTSDVCSVLGATVSVRAAGSCTIRAQQVPAGADATQYEAALPVDSTFTIAKATPTIAVTSSTQIVYRETTTVMATVTGGGAVAIDLQSGTPSHVTVNSTAGTITANVADEQVTIRIRAAESANYAAGFIDVVFTLVRATQTISIPDRSDPSGETPTITTDVNGAQEATITYAPDRVVDLGASASSDLPVTFVSTNPSVAVVETVGNTQRLTVTGVGTSVIKVDQAGQAGTYLPAVQREVTLRVTKASQGFVVPGWPSSVTFGDDPIPLQASNTIAGRTVDLASTTPDVCRVTPQGALDVIGVGTCTIAAFDPGDSNYNALSQQFSVSVARATRTVTITARVDGAVREDPIEIQYLNEQVAIRFEASAENDSPKTVTTVGPCTWDSATSVVSSTGAGRCEVTVSVGQGANYLGATSTLVINISKAPQRITGIVKGTDPNPVLTPQLAADVLSWTITRLNVGVNTAVTVGTVLAELVGERADGSETDPVTVVATVAGWVSWVRDLTVDGSDVGVQTGELLVVIESLRNPVTSGSVTTPALPTGYTSWAVTGTTALGDVLDIGEIAARIRPQVTVATGDLPAGATSWSVTLTRSAGSSVNAADGVATATPQRRIVSPGLPRGTSSWFVSELGANTVSAADTVLTLKPERILTAPALPSGATSWEVVSVLAEGSPLSSADDGVAVLRAMGATGAVGSPVTIPSGLAGVVFSADVVAGQRGLLAGARLVTLHGQAQSITSPLAGSVSNRPALNARVGAGELVAVVSAAAQTLLAGGVGTISAVAADLEVMEAGETVLRVRADEQVIVANLPGTVTLSTGLESALGGQEPVLVLASPRADSRNVRIIAPAVPSTAPEDATFTVVQAVETGTAVLPGDVIAVLELDAAPVPAVTPALPQVTETNPVAAASFRVESVVALGTAVSAGSVVAVLRPIGTDERAFATTVEVLSPIDGIVVTVPATQGDVLLNGVTLVTVGYTPFTVTAPAPGRVLTSIVPGSTARPGGSTVAFLEETLRFGQKQLLSATPGPSGAGLRIATSTPQVCAIVPFLGGEGVIALGVGECIVTFAQDGDDNYLDAPTETIIIRIDRAEQEVALDVVTEIEYGSDPVTPQVRAADGADVVVASGNTDILVVEDGQLVPVGVGTVEVTAVAGSTDRYNSSAPVRATIEVVPGTQTIAMVAPPAAVAGGRVQIAATARSGLDVLFTSTTPGVCTVTGDQLVLLSAGACVIEADQPGSALWRPAATVTRTINVSPRPVAFGASTLTVESRGAGRLTTVNLRALPMFAKGTIRVRDIAQRAADMVSIVDGVLRVDPPRTFSGVIRFTLEVNDGAVSQLLQVRVDVPATNPTQISFAPVSGGESRISWSRSPNAELYLVKINGRTVCYTPRTVCVVQTFLGPNSRVSVQAMGEDSLYAAETAPGTLKAIPGQRLAQAALRGGTITSAGQRRFTSLATRLTRAGYEWVRVVVPVGPSERRGEVRAQANRVAALFRNQGLSVITSVVRATPAQVRAASRARTRPSATVSVRLVVPVTDPRLPDAPRTAAR